MKNDDAIRDLIDTYVQAELTGDGSAYADLLTEDFRGIGPVGFVLTAKQWAARHDGDLENHEFTIIEPRTRAYGTTIVVDGVQRQVTTARGADTSGEFRISLVCVADGDAWRIAQAQLSGPLISAEELPRFAR